MTDLIDEMHMATELLGSDFAAICARYGAPIRCEHERGVLRLVYEGESEQLGGTVDLVDGVVVAMRGTLHGSRHWHRGQEMVGQPVEAVLPKLGKPRRTVLLGDSTRLEFAQYAITVHEGLVACVVPRD
jgi:hypothetical protein